MPTRSLLPCHGGKYYMVKNLLPLLTEHVTYIEHFAGGAALFFSKPPSELEVLNDIDGDLINFFRVLQDEVKFKALYRLVTCTPFSRQVYQESRATLLDGTDVEQAYKFFIVAMQSFSGTRGSWGGSRHGRKNIVKWLNRISQLPEFHDRLMQAQIENLDFRESLHRYNDSQTFHYIDPPYLNFSGGFRFKMTQADHEDLLDLAIMLCGKVMVSGYRNRLYDERLADWHRLDFEVCNRLAQCTPGSGGIAVESVWLNKRAENHE